MPLLVVTTLLFGNYNVVNAYLSYKKGSIKILTNFFQKKIMKRKIGHSRLLAF